MNPSAGGMYRPVEIGPSAAASLRMKNALTNTAVAQRLTRLSMATPPSNWQDYDSSPAGKKLNLGIETLLGSNFGDQLDLNAGAKWNLGDAERTSGMASICTEHFVQQLGGTIGDDVLLGKAWSAVDQDHDL